MAVQTIAPAYAIYWSAKFDDIDGDALMMFNRLYSKFQRMQEKYPEDNLMFVMGASEYSTKMHKGWTFKMVYPVAKKKGGRKECRVSTRINTIRNGQRISGELIDIPPKTAPHIHIMVIGRRASTHAQAIVDYLAKQEKRSGRKPQRKWKKALPDSYAISNSYEYIEGQSTHFRSF